MALIIKWNKRAKTTFDKTVDYLENDWGIESAIKFVQKVNRVLMLMQSYPEIGKKEKPKTDLFSIVITKQITLFYRLKSDTIILVNFFDTRKSPVKKRKR
jgi:plasmid stabilization system protein ParE